MRTRRRLGICLEEVIEQRLVHAASDVHRLVFAAHGPVKCHVGITTHQVDLVVKTICKHCGEAFVSDRDLFGCNDVVQVERTNSVSHSLLHTIKRSVICSGRCSLSKLPSSRRWNVTRYNPRNVEGADFFLPLTKFPRFRMRAVYLVLEV